MKKMRIAAALAATCVTVTAFAFDNRPPGIEAGVFYPSDAVTQSLFGETWIRVGFSPQGPLERGESFFSWDVSYFWAEKFGNHAYLLPFSFGFSTPTTSRNGAKPYVLARVGPVYYDLQVWSAGLDERGLAFDANAAVGIANRGFYVEARYDWFSDMHGLDFSGLSFSVGYRVPSRYRY